MGTSIGGAGFVLRRVIVVFVVLAGAGAAFWAGLRFSPYPRLDAFRARPVSARVYDRHGVLLTIRALPGGLRRERVDYETMPPFLIRYFILSEDGRFYRHHGIDLPSIIRTTYFSIKYKRVTGGASTITMQLARIITPRPKTLRGKMLEALDATRLETRLTKREILTAYLNSVPYGHRTEGVASAARTFYGKELTSLNNAQLLGLVIIPRRPADYAPGKNVAALARKCDAFAKRVGLSSSLARIERDLMETSVYRYPDLSPHFTRYLLDHTPQNVPEARASLDDSLNVFIADNLAAVLRGEESHRLERGAVLAIDTQTGEVLGYVGSPNFLDESDGQVDGVRILRQPGSTLKPFLYAQALETGFGPQTLLPDVPSKFGVENVYRPLNFDNRFSGPVRFRTALASSLNVPAVYLLNRLGVSTFVDTLARVGFRSVEARRREVGLSLALGGVDVSLWELTRAFSLFTRGGTVPALSILKRDVSANGERAFSRRTAAYICSILSDTAARTPGFGETTAFNLPFPAIFKTGTSNQYQNLWALASTPRHTVGVWMGNFDNKTAISRTGSGLPTTLARRVLLKIERESSPLPQLVGVRSARICALSGMAATSACPDVITEEIPAETLLEPCTFHTIENGMSTVHIPREYDATPDN